MLGRIDPGAGGRSANEGGAVVVADDGARAYGEDDTAVRALRGVSHEIDRAKRRAVMGRSGSGASTLMQMDELAAR